MPTSPPAARRPRPTARRPPSAAHRSADPPPTATPPPAPPQRSQGKGAGPYKVEGGKELFEVERILDTRHRGASGPEYLVSWVGYARADDSCAAA